MKKTFFISLTAILFLAVTSFSILETKCHKYKLNGTVYKHTPYCGGVRPSPEIENGTNSVFANQTFGIVNDTTSRKVVEKFTTDNNGYFSVNLKKGHYFVFLDFKLTDFDTFYKNFSKKEHFKVPKDKKCFLKWYKTPEFEITLTQDTTIKFTVNAQCFVGLNPCMQYTGPRPM